MAEAAIRCHYPLHWPGSFHDRLYMVWSPRAPTPLGIGTKPAKPQPRKLSSSRRSVRGNGSTCWPPSPVRRSTIFEKPLPPEDDNDIPF